MRKVIFLYFDGVLNSAEWQVKQRRCSGGSFLQRHMDELDPAAVFRLNKLIADTGAACVVSSSWRILHTIEELRGFLTAAGFAGEVIGVTPRLSVSPYKPTERRAVRGDEINLWLDRERDAGRPVDAFVILDDDSDMDQMSPWLVQTDWVRGLRMEHVKKATEILNRE